MRFWIAPVTSVIHRCWRARWINSLVDLQKYWCFPHVMDACNEFSSDVFLLHIIIISERIGLGYHWLNTCCGHYVFTMVAVLVILGGHLLNQLCGTEPGISQLGHKQRSDIRMTQAWWRSLVSHRGSSKLLLHGWHQGVTTQSGWGEGDLGRFGPSVIQSRVSLLGVDGKEVSKGKKSWRRSPTETWYPRRFNSNRKPLTWRQARHEKTHTKKYFSLTPTWNDSLVLTIKDRMKIHISDKRWWRWWNGIKQDLMRWVPTYTEFRGSFLPT